MENRFSIESQTDEEKEREGKQKKKEVNIISLVVFGVFIYYLFILLQFKLGIFLV